MSWTQLRCLALRRVFSLIVLDEPSEIESQVQETINQALEAEDPRLVRSSPWSVGRAARVLRRQRNGTAV